MASLEIYDGTVWRTLGTKGLLISATIGTNTVASIASSLSIILPPDGTMCKFTLLGSGGIGGYPTTTADYGFGGGGAGGAAIWCTSIYATDTVTLQSPNTTLGQTGSPNTYTSTVNNYVVTATAGGPGNSGTNISGGTGGTVSRSGSGTLNNFFSFNGSDGGLGAVGSGGNPVIRVSAGTGGNSIFGGGGIGGNTVGYNPTAGKNATGGGGGGGVWGLIFANGAAGGSGVLVIEW